MTDPQPPSGSEVIGSSSAGAARRKAPIIAVSVTLSWVLGASLIGWSYVNPEERCPGPGHAVFDEGGERPRMWSIPSMAYGVNYGGSVRDRVYTAAVAEGPAAGALPIGPAVTNAVFEVGVRQRSTSAGEAGAYIVFRDDGSGGYVLGLSPGGEYSLRAYKSASNDWIPIESGQYDQEPTGALESAEVDRVEVVLIGDRSEIWINGVQIASYEDPHHPYGTFGLGAYATGPGSATIEYHNPLLKPICDRQPLYGMWEALAQAWQILARYSIAWVLAILAGRAAVLRLQSIGFGTWLATHISRRAVILIGLLLLLGFALIVCPWLTRLEHCISGVAIRTWVDLNLDGNLDSSEPPMPRVWYGDPAESPFSRLGGSTDERGEAVAISSILGCPGDFGGWVEASAPAGYVATTPLYCRAENFADVCYFGFAPLVEEPQ